MTRYIRIGCEWVRTTMDAAKWAALPHRSMIGNCTRIGAVAGLGALGGALPPLAMVPDAMPPLPSAGPVGTPGGVLRETGSGWIVPAGSVSWTPQGGFAPGPGNGLPETQPQIQRRTGASPLTLAGEGVVDVPEPPAWAVFGVALVGVGLVRLHLRKGNSNV